MLTLISKLKPSSHSWLHSAVIWADEANVGEKEKVIYSFAM